MDDISDFAYRLADMATELGDAVPEMWDKGIKEYMTDTAGAMAFLATELIAYVEKEEKELAEIKAMTD